MLEISAVVVPANPQAVALALDKGVINEEQLKGLKSQLADGIKNVDRLIEKQGVDNKGISKTKAKVTTEEKIGDHSKSTTVEITLNADQVKELVEAVNKAAERLEAATKAANATDENTDGDAGANDEKDDENTGDADDGKKSLTTDTTLDDTKGMETKAGASLSKANMEKLKACHKALTDMKAMCDEHMGVIADMVGDMNDDSEAKATATDQTKAVDGEEAKADKQEVAKAETAEGTNNNEQQTGDDNADGKGEGEVNSEAEKADEGANQKDAGDTSKAEEADKADDGEELVDPEDLTPEQAEKIAAAVNEELEKLKQ